MNQPLGLGRRVPTDDTHIRRYPLTAATAPTKPVPVTLGVNWYENFDKPVLINRRYFIGLGNLGDIRGGHCVCIPPTVQADNYAWYDFYNQGKEGSCVGFGSSRMMSILNRKRYDARWLYQTAQRVDEWDDTPPEEGTSVRAAMDVLRDMGHKPFFQGKLSLFVDIQEGIAANRWAQTIDQILSVLQNKYYQQMEAMPILNSWGRNYPHVVWLPLKILQRLLNEDGESTMITDR